MWALLGDYHRDANYIVVYQVQTEANLDGQPAQYACISAEDVAFRSTAVECKCFDYRLHTDYRNWLSAAEQPTSFGLGQDCPMLQF